MTTHDADYWREQYARAVARAERLQAENERLRAALLEAADRVLVDTATTPRA